MCGIAALLGSSAEREAESALLQRMLRVATRRGPEGTGVHAFANGVIAHTALHFVDNLFNHQPLVHDDGSSLVFNGEIYNWRTLNVRYALGARNDTQLLLRGLCARGSAFLSELDGQFAFVAHVACDGQATRAIVGRDRWGICPLVFGHTPQGWLAIGSTCEAVQAAFVQHVKVVPAGTLGCVAGTQLSFQAWYRLPRTQLGSQPRLDRLSVQRFAVERVHSRIPEVPRQLFTTMGGIDSQFVTATVARDLGLRFGGAVTVVPWTPPSLPAHAVRSAQSEPESDLPYVNATLHQLASEDAHVRHHVVVLTPAVVEASLDRLLKLLGPDLFHILCGLAEDLVAVTVRRLGGRTIMTAGGPDEAGRSYDRWTVLHRGLDEELAWHRLAEQFASSEGVRAGLIFGEHGLENRVPLADLIEFATQISSQEKQRVYEVGDGLTVAALRLDSKIFWRSALVGLLPSYCLAARKQPIHGSTGAMRALFAVLACDQEFLQQRAAFVVRAWHLGWNGIVFGDLLNLDPTEALTECQLYALYRWSKLEPELFDAGAESRYGRFIEFLPRSVDEPCERVAKPLCYDWQLGPDVPLRKVH
ncbi:MAG: putative asparagine synthase b protein [Pseudomonadota bacterium]|jgi:asparagine synthetase B (glutamine-hydrolysing)